MWHVTGTQKDKIKCYEDLAVARTTQCDLQAAATAVDQGKVEHGACQPPKMTRFVFAWMQHGGVERGRRRVSWSGAVQGDTM